MLILVTLFAVAAASYGARFLYFNPDTRVFFGEHSPERLALDQVESTYGKINSLVIVVAPHNRNVFTPDNLRIIRELTERAWQAPYTLSVYSLTNYQDSHAEGDTIVVKDLVGDSEVLDDARVAAIRKTVLGSRELVDKLVSRAGDVAAIAVKSVQPANDRNKVPDIAGFARKLRDEARRDYPSVDVRLSGSIMADMSFAEAGKRELAALAPIMFALMFATLIAGLRSIWAASATMLVIGFSVMTSLGLRGLGRDHPERRNGDRAGDDHGPGAC